MVGGGEGFDVKSGVCCPAVVVCPQAQQCDILKSVADGKPRLMLAKLEMGLQTLYGDANRCLGALVRAVPNALAFACLCARAHPVT